MDNQLVDYPISDITVADLRYRKDMGDVQGLAESIKTIGLLTPIIVSDKGVLLAGERRLRAHILLGKDTISAIIRTDHEIDNKIVEAIENIERKDFSWQEKVLAMEELHRNMIARYGKIGETWGLRKTAEKAGLSLGGVSTQLNIASALKESPEIFEGCSTYRQAMKALQKAKIDEAMVELALRKKKTDYGIQAQNLIFNGDCLDLIKRLPSSSVDALISDPVYGVDFFENRFTDKELGKGYFHKEFDDSSFDFCGMMESLAQEAARVMKPNSVLFTFCGFDNAKFLIELWSKYGFHMDQIPGIWAKTGQTARSNAPDRYFNRSYEMFVYGCRNDYVLAKQGTLNVISIPGLLTAGRDHPTQKPIPLMEEIIIRLCLPGSVILDPMAGSAATAVAAIKRGHIPICFELDKTFYDIALVNISRALELKASGEVERIGV